MDSGVERGATTVIEASRAHFWRDLREVWDYRGLVWLFAKRDLFIVYKQTVLGPVWFFIQPVIMAFVFTVVFGRVANINTGGVPHIVFYMAGTVAWNFFTAVVNYAAQSLYANAGVLSKVWFPRLALPFASVFTNLAHLGLGLAVFLVFYCRELLRGAPMEAGWWLLALPLVTLQLSALALGVGLLTAAATVKYRDLRFALPFIMQIWMYATPIVYPVSGIVDPRLRSVMLANPVAPAVELFRHAFTGAGTVEPRAIAVSAAATLVIFTAGLAAFNKAQRNFVDII